MIQMDKLGNISLYNCDCMEILRTLPDNAYDLAIVDPPYGDAGFQDPPRQATNRDGGGGSDDTRGRWNRFGQRFDRYKRSMPESHGAIRAVQAANYPPLFAKR